MKKLSSIILFIIFSKGGYAQFTTSGANAYFNLPGSFAIGPTSPRAKLDVMGVRNINTGQLLVRDSASVAANIGGAITFGGNYSGLSYAEWAGIAGLKSNATTGDYSGYLSFFTRTNGASQTEKMRITSDGSVGIGVNAPQSGFKLDVAGQTVTRGSAYIEGILYKFGNSDFLIRQDNPGYKLHLGTSTGTALTVIDGGRVGIGTPAPQSQLELASSNPLELRVMQNAQGAVVLRRSTSIAYILSESGGPLKRELAFGNQESTNGTLNEYARFSSAGKFGIGTKNPDEMLTVNGNVHTKEVKVDLNIPAPDYVFDKTYKLRSLAEVSRYIAANSHLPEIPSAKTMETDGVKLGEMNMQLLKKVEELTLYLIQEQKERTELEIRLQKMESKLKKYRR